MKHSFRQHTLTAAVALALCTGAHASVFVQCPGDTDGDALWNSPGETPPAAPTKCMHLTAGDGFAVGSDGHPMYTFGFSDRTGTPANQAISQGILGAHWPGPSIELEEDQHFYLSLTNVGSAMRPDLFDPHTVHFHGFPNAAPVFDGVPELSTAINQGATTTYYYNLKDPGTYIYHCHVQATEHMEMGMLANLYVHPKQDKTGCASGSCPVATRQGGATGAPLGYVYNDNDGTTAYDVEAPLQVSSFDADFHDANLKAQPLPFALLEGNYPQINGRGYPDTVKGKLAMGAPKDDGFASGTPGQVINNGEIAQDMSALIMVTKGQRLLLRLSNVSIDRFFTLMAPGLTMKIVGVGAKLLRGTDGKNLYQETASVNFGGGETHDVIIETANVAPGTYFLHAAELHQMSNKTQMDGGLITEIVVN
jgi:FtsP/CotA-like multicopper oxidase with cupredoxin domain